MTYVSNNQKFKYYDDKKCSNVKNFVKPMEQIELRFEDFVQQINKGKSKGQRIYLQQPLNESVGKRIVADFLGFNWNWVTSQQKKNKFGQLTNNMLLIGQEGNITPVHYDEQENFFAQVFGYKRFILFPPEEFPNLYPHPTYHPCDRQSQVSLTQCCIYPHPKSTVTLVTDKVRLILMILILRDSQSLKMPVVLRLLLDREMYYIFLCIGGIKLNPFQMKDILFL